ncbi:MAG: hypothetical protein JO041_15405 [Acidobacteria bacterium]|nr:hypothetical protein [Acidobacteriota bacterium]
MKRAKPPAARKREDWPYEREGYSDLPGPAHASAHAAAGPTVDSAPPSGRLQAFLGSVLAGCGAVWAAEAVVQAHFLPGTLTRDPHPMELTGAGLLIWLHGKWRRATQLR